MVKIELITPSSYAGFLRDLSKQRVFALDTETTSKKWLDAELLCMSFSWEKDKGWVLPLGCFDFYGFDGKDFSIQKAVTFLNPILARSRVVFHNAPYDIHVINKYGFKIKRLDDTLIMSAMIDPHRFRSLDNRALDIGMVLGEHKHAVKACKDAKSLQPYIEYSGKDAVATFRLRQKYKTDLKLQGQWELYCKQERALIKPVIEMENNGMPVSLKFLKGLQTKLIHILRKCQQKIFREAGHEFNIASNPQLVEVLFKQLQLPVLKKSLKTRKPSADASVLEALAEKADICKFLLEHRQVSKLLNTYVSDKSEVVSCAVKRNGWNWIHARINQSAASSLRWSISEPALQTIPADDKASFGLRDAFRAPPGYVLVVADYNQIELRVAAHYSKSKLLIDSYQKGSDIHQNVADELGIDRRAAKCVTGDTLITTTHGIIPMQYVVDEMHKFKSIQMATDIGKACIRDKYSGGVKSCVRVTLEDGLYLDCSVDHKILTVQNGVVKHIKARELVPKDNVVVKLGANVHGREIKISWTTQKKVTSYIPWAPPSVMTSELALWLGYYVSEGCCSGGYGYTVQLVQVASGVNQEINSISRRLFGERVKRRVRSRGRYKRITTWVVHSKDLKKFLSDQKAGRVSGEKGIPLCIARAPARFKRLFLSALFEGDGCVKVRSRMVSYCTKSPLLARQVCAELWNLGIRTHLLTSHGMWYLNIQGREYLSKFRDSVNFRSKLKRQALQRVLVGRYSKRFYMDGFENVLQDVVNKKKSLFLRELSLRTSTKTGRFLKRRHSAYNLSWELLRTSLRNKVRITSSLLSKFPKRYLPKEINYFLQHDLGTSRVRSVKCLGKLPVYDVYAPKRPNMINNGGIVTLDTISFGMLYGMGVKKLASTLGISEGKAQEYLNRYYLRLPEILDLKRQVIAVGRAKKYIKLISGRKHIVPKDLFSADDIARGHAERSLMNALIQASSREIMAQAILNCYKSHILRKHAKMLMTVHDELIYLCKEAHGEEVLKEMKRCMEALPWTLRVPIIADGSVGATWRAAKAT